ncbi:MAG: tetratricopeptide repeat protein [Planctomycetes bacterium]|nr:tetratricopeptide repeat protein [Planctomycetota bacterium]
MKLRTAACFAALFFGLAADAPAQRAVQRGRQPVNPRHEEIKTEADQAYQKGDFRKAYELADSIVRQNPSDHVALYLRGSARIELGTAVGDSKQIRSGIGDVREAIRINGTQDLNYYLPYLAGMTRLTPLEGRKDHAETAVQVANQVLGQRGLSAEERANLLYQRASTQGVLGETEKAIADFREVLKSNPRHLGAHLGLGEALAATGQEDEALAQFNRAVRAAPSNPLVYNNRGMFLQKLGRYDDAVGDFTRAIELDGNYFFAYTNRGFTLLESGKPEAAEADFTQSLRINPRQPAVHSLRATARLEGGDLEKALADHFKVVELDPESPVAHADLAFARFFSGDYDRALKSFDKAVELDAQFQYLDPWRYLTLEHLDNEEDARERFAERLKQSADQRDWVGSLLAFLADEITAEELLASVEKTDTAVRDAQLAEAHYFIGRKLALAGDAQAAADHYRKVLETKARHLSAYRGARMALAPRGRAAGSTRIGPEGN